MSPALAGGFLTTVPPGKSLTFVSFTQKTLQFDFSSDHTGGGGYCQVIILKINPKVSTEVLCFILCGPLNCFLGELAHPFISVGLFLYLLSVFSQHFMS